MELDRLRPLVGTGGGDQAEAGMIVERGQRMAAPAAGKPDMALEVHLPEIVGRGMLEAAGRRRVGPTAPSATPWRRRMAAMVEGAGGAKPWRERKAAILRPPQAGCAARVSRTLASTAAALRLGEACGRRERGESPAIPSEANRPSSL